MEGVGDVEEACYLGLKPGSRILLWYADDSVWHEALVGLVLGGEEIVMYTPDKDLYVQAIGCKGDYGPVKLKGLLPNGNLPRNLRAPAYRFREKVTDELIRQVFRDALALAGGEGRHYTTLTAAGFSYDGQTWGRISESAAKRLSEAGWELNPSFQEVPAFGLRREFWSPKQWGRWLFSEAIGILEARAVLKASKDFHLQYSVWPWYPSP